MPKKQIDVAAKKVSFVMDKPADAPEGFAPEVFIFDLSMVNEETRDRLALHGASQKIGDSYAGAKESGEDPIKYATDAVNETIAQLYRNEWAIARSGGGAPRTSLLVQAYAAIKGVSLEEAQEVIGSLTDEEKKAVQGTKKIAAWIAMRRAEQAAERAKKLAEAAAAEDATAE
jgi:hypothetical protein